MVLLHETRIPKDLKLYLYTFYHSLECAEYQKAVYENVTIFNGFGLPYTYKTINKCAFTSVPFIVNGVVAAPKEFPHMVAMDTHFHKEYSVAKYVITCL